MGAASGWPVDPRAAGTASPFSDRRRRHNGTDCVLDVFFCCCCCSWLSRRYVVITILLRVSPRAGRNNTHRHIRARARTHNHTHTHAFTVMYRGLLTCCVLAAAAACSSAAKVPSSTVTGECNYYFQNITQRIKYVRENERRTRSCLFYFFFFVVFNRVFPTKRHRTNDASTRQTRFFVTWY